MRCASLVVLTVLAACSFTPGGGLGDDDPQIDASPLPVDASELDAADLDATPLPIDAAIDAVPVCMPSCDSTGMILTTCNANVPSTEVCAQGCAVAPAPHCKQLSPSNGATLADLDGVTAALQVPLGRLFLFDSADGSIDNYDLTNLGLPPIPVRAAGDGLIAGIGFRRTEQAAGRPGLAVWSVAAVTVDAGASLPMHGTMRFVGVRAAIVLSRGAISIRGAVDAGAGHSLGLDCRECAGPGGGTGATRTAVATGCAPGGNGEYSSTADETGGAGGGFGTMGANGGDNAVLEGGTAVSILNCAGPTLIPLQGGGGGGRGAYTTTSGGAGGVVGGGAGGAIQLTSLASIGVAGTADLYAGGRGGEGSVDDYGGGGGGAGGGLLLEAPAVTIGDTAHVTANGGGGGAGRTANAGEVGNRGSMRADGGAGDGGGMNNGRGGKGGKESDTITTTLPSQGNGMVDGTGGGGAAAGRIRINTGPTMPPVIGTTTVFSPSASIGTRPIE